MKDIPIHFIHQHSDVFNCLVKLFQEITTAKTILEKPETRESYNRIVRLRTYMSQCDDTDTMMDPYLIYSLYKINKKNAVQNRLLTVSD